MKKIFFYVGLVAVATSCTDAEFDSLSVQEQGRGIVFESIEGVDSRMQWDQKGNVYDPFWYAEQDRIGIFGLMGTTSSDGWNHMPAAAMGNEYKATQSKKNGVFTSVNDANTLEFNGSKTARFLAVYPKTIKATHSAGKLVLSNLPSMTAQNQTNANGMNEAIMMYDWTTASKENSYDAVGEKVQLAFKRPMSAIVFKTANANAYTTGNNSVFGNLQKITFEAKGYDKVSTDGALAVANGDILPTMIAYDATKATLEVDTIATSKAAVYKKGTTPVESSVVTLTLGSAAGLAWNDNALAIASVLNVDRKAFRDKNVSEAIEVTYSFANIDIVSQTKEVSVDFNGFMAFPALDIEKYDYLVTKGTVSGSVTSGRTLIVNSGNFADIFNEAQTAVVWKDVNATSGSVAPTEFTEVIVNEDVVLTDTEFALLEKFTNVTKLTLKGNTELKTGSLDALTALTVINMPKVTTIATKVFNPTGAAAKFTEVYLPAYSFEKLDINPQILNPATLVKLDISGVSVMNAGFPSKGLTLEGYGKLTTVTVKNGVLVGSNAFKDCLKLKSITGKVTLEGTAAFMNCGSDATSKLTTINITNTDIPANTFEGCTYLKSIKVDGKQVVPTEVGVQAFKGCAALVEMDLSKATKVGQEAFMNCTSFVGVKKADNDKNVLTVGASFIAKDAFKSCNALEYVYFKEATSFAETIISSSLLKEVKFGEPFVLNGTYKDTLFGNASMTGVKLFVNPDQDVATIDNHQLVIPTTRNSNGVVTATAKIPFASITKEKKF